MHVRALLSLLLVGCVPPALAPSSPTEPSETVEGTLTCGQILTDCDAECVAPDCVQACETRGTSGAQRLHAALVACARTSGCVEQTCVMERCSAEVEACQADGATPPQPESQPSPPPDHEASPPATNETPSPPP